MDTVTANKKTHTAIWAITPQGIQLGQRLCPKLGHAVLYLPETQAPSLSGECAHHCFDVLAREVQKEFQRYANHIFIFATGISVRIIAPLLVSKTTDPAVVVMDEKGFYAISLVSGHLGGANALARELALITGAIPVVTTATDVNRLPSIDMIAQKNNLAIETPENIKHVNMKFLKGETVRIWDPKGFIAQDIPAPLISTKGPYDGPDLICSHETLKVSRETLLLRPRILSLGIGCNKHTSPEEIMDLITTVFTYHQLSVHAIRGIGTSDVKRNETGIIQTAEQLDRPLAFYGKDELNQVETVENPSEMAQKHLGVKSVCEAAAILGAKKGPLLIPKQKTQNATLAVAMVK
jgi:cobalt-precorrin 5A hydrolase